VTVNEIEVMLDAVADRGIVKFDVTGRVLRWSAGAQALLGYSEDEALGAPFSTFLAEDDLATGAFEAALAAARESGRIEFEGWRVRDGFHRSDA
jgi:PAS domain S-box-containing protein